jgi:hypothetical protein
LVAGYGDAEKDVPQAIRYGILIVDVHQGEPVLRLQSLLRNVA